jgi:hypothetical protein
MRAGAKGLGGRFPVGKHAEWPSGGARGRFGLRGWVAARVLKSMLFYAGF